MLGRANSIRKEAEPHAGYLAAGAHELQRAAGGSTQIVESLRNNAVRAF
jgi:hypothetical protein